LSTIKVNTITTTATGTVLHVTNKTEARADWNFLQNITASSGKAIFGAITGSTIKVVDASFTGDIDVGDNLTLSSDSAVLSLGAGADATLTHDGTTGLTIAATPISINSTGDLTLDSSTDIVFDAAGGNFEFKDSGTTQLTIDVDSTAGDIDINLNVNGDDLVFNQYDGTEVLRLTDAGNVEVKDNLYLTSNASEIKFGSSLKEVKLIHDNGSNPGLIVKAATATGLNIGFPTFTLQAADNDITAHQTLGVIAFQAPDDTAEGAAILNAASISAQAEENFSSTVNATKLIFATAESGSQTVKMELSSEGNLTVNSAGIFGGGTSNAQTINTTTLPANYNSVLYGPITIDSGGSFNISAGSNVKIVDIVDL
jgi:hypothetical protein